MTTTISTHFKIVLVDETSHWTSEELKLAAGKIFSAYMYDENRPTNLAELRPSYEMHLLEHVPQNQVNDYFDELLRSEVNSDHDPVYKHCCIVDAWSETKEVVDLGEETHNIDPDEDRELAYYTIVEKEIENQRCNPHCWNLSEKKPSPR